MINQLSILLVNKKTIDAGDRKPFVFRNKTFEEK